MIERRMIRRVGVGAEDAGAGLNKTDALNVIGYTLVSATFGAGVWLALTGSVIIGIPLAVAGPTLAVKALGAVAGVSPKE